MKSSEPLTKHTLLLFTGDWEKLQAYGEKRELGASVIVRMIVRKFIEGVEKGVKTKTPVVAVEEEL